MDIIGDGKNCKDICKHAPPEKGKWPCEDCDMRWHDRAEPKITHYTHDGIIYGSSATNSK